MNFLSLNNLDPLINGFIISLSIITSVGPQNTFVIRYGLARRFVPYILLTCILGDFILIGIGIFGTAEIFEQYKYAPLIMGIIGMTFLVYFSIKYFKSAFTQVENIEIGKRVSDNLKKVTLQLLALTFLNPTVITETIILIGGVSSRYSTKAEIIAYFIGTMLASITWFSLIGIFTKVMFPLFQKQISWRILDVFSGSIMLIIAFVLGKNLYEKYSYLII